MASGRYLRCLDACPTEAIKFGEESEFKDLIAKAEELYPEYKAKPKVYYLNIPKKFIGGTVYDPVEKEVVIGASCTLSSDGKKLKAICTRIWLPVETKETWKRARFRL